MTLEEILNKGKEKLRAAQIEEADLDAWLLLEYVTGISRAMYYVRQKEEAAKEQERRYEEVILSRSRRIPLQHITGRQEFMGLTFKVNEHVLVPRQDTEILVEEAFQTVRQDMNILDLCTGSGCILISLASLAKERGIRLAECTGADISPEALEAARENASVNDVEVSFVQGDLFENINGKYDLIVSNPPYIKTSEIGHLEPEVREHDPILALDGKEDGLYFYRSIIDQAPAYLTDNGALYFEIGYDQAADIKEMMEERGFAGVTVKKDLTGLDRVVYGVYNRAEKLGGMKPCLTN